MIFKILIMIMRRTWKMMKMEKTKSKIDMFKSVLDQKRAL
jgi:hypothetical protein